MKNNFFLIVLFATAFFSAGAQTFSIKQGEEFKPEDGASFNYYIGNNANGIYLQRTSTKGAGITKIFQRIDPVTLKSTYTQGFELDRREESNGTYLIDNKILAFTVKFEKQEEKKYLLLREYDALTGKSLGDVKQVSVVPCTPKELNDVGFGAVFSEDKSKMAILSTKNRDIEIAVYNSKTFAKISTKKVLEAYKNSTIRAMNYRIDNAGNLYYLFYYMKDFEKRIGGFALAVNADNQKPTIVELPLDRFEIQNGAFEFVNNDIVFSGLFKDETNSAKPDVGFFSFFIDGKTLEIKRKGFDYFDPHVKEKLSYADGLVKKDPADKFYSFENIFTFNENVYLIESHSYAISGNGYISYERELIVSKFNKEGKLEWMKIIPKFTANKLNDFNFLVRNNKVYLFYAEHPKNMEKSTVDEYDPKKYNEIKNYNGSLLVCTTFDEKGNLSRKEVLKNDGWCYDPISTNIIVDKENGVILKMINRNNERYDKITID